MQQSNWPQRTQFVTFAEALSAAAGTLPLPDLNFRIIVLEPIS
jgi:hypothetical protein